VDLYPSKKSLLEALPPKVRERILAVLMGHRHRLRFKTLWVYGHALGLLATRGDLDDVTAMEDLIPQETRRYLLEAMVAAYRHYCKWWRLPEPELRIKRDRRRPLPKIAREDTLQASLVVPKRVKWQAYFRLLYETGARASEPFALRVIDIQACLDREKIRIGTSKYGGFTTEREFPISPLLTAQLRLLIKDRGPEDPVFHQTLDPSKPSNYHMAERVMALVRKQLRATGYNVQGLRLHGYRHAFATRLYHATKDLALVSQSLGHKDLGTTMIYVHLKPDQPRRYDVIHVEIGDKEKIGAQIGEGWEIALQTADTVYFRRPRWIP